MKFMILLVAVLVLAWLVSGSWRRYKQRGESRRTGATVPQVEGMVACAHCGVHLPASLAVVGEPARKERYCSVPHRDAGPRAR